MRQLLLRRCSRSRLPSWGGLRGQKALLVQQWTLLGHLGTSCSNLPSRGRLTWRLMLPECWWLSQQGLQVGQGPLWMIWQCCPGSCLTWVSFISKNKMSSGSCLQTSMQ